MSFYLLLLMGLCLQRFCFSFVQRWHVPSASSDGIRHPWWLCRSTNLPVLPAPALGVAVGPRQLRDVFSPTGMHWQKSIQSPYRLDRLLNDYFLTIALRFGGFFLYIFLFGTLMLHVFSTAPKGDVVSSG